MFKFKVEISRYGHNYANALAPLGVQIIDTPTCLLDGLLLSGGGDVSPCIYSAVNRAATDTDIFRDQKELFLIKKYLSANKPILGICRGLQILNVYFGGSLYQHVNGHSQVNAQDTIHPVTTVKNTFMHSLYGHSLQVNSAHHQSIDKLGKGLKACAISQDGVIEAISGHNLIATQFHPERLPVHGQKIFEYYYSLLSKGD